MSEILQSNDKEPNATLEGRGWLLRIVATSCIAAIIPLIKYKRTPFRPEWSSLRAYDHQSAYKNQNHTRKRQHISPDQATMPSPSQEFPCGSDLEEFKESMTFMKSPDEFSRIYKDEEIIDLVEVTHNKCYNKQGERYEFKLELWSANGKENRLPYCRGTRHRMSRNTQNPP